jgi:mono/diheme cytochrome c family protein
MLERCVVAVVLLPVLSGAAAADGASLFAENCVACHQAGGVGTPGLAPPLVSETLKKAGDVQRDYVPLVIIHGLSGPIKVKGQLYLSAMPPRSDFSDDDIAAIANYVEADLNGIKAAPLAASDVTPLRTATVDHQTLRDMRSKFGE